MARGSRAIFAPLLLVSGLGCGMRLVARPTNGSNYLEFVSFETLDHEHVLLHWRREDMPLAVYLPKPPDGMFTDGEAVWNAVREGVLEWSDAAGPGLPSFRFVDSLSDADIPITWGGTPSSFEVAHCMYALHYLEHFAVAHVVVYGRFRDGSEADLDYLRLNVAHEMGHALGIGGHSPNPGDVMYPFSGRPQNLDPRHVSDRVVAKIVRNEEISPRSAEGLSERDRETLRLLYARPVGTRIAAPRRVY
jgi:predicted Zn-dependent protease